MFLALDLTDIVEVQFKSCAFQDIGTGSFNFKSSNVSVIINGTTEPFEFNQRALTNSTGKFFLVCHQYKV